MSTKTTKAATRKAQPKTQPEVTPLPKRARGASKVAEAAARRPVPQPPTTGLSDLLPRIPKSARAKVEAKKAAKVPTPKAGKRVSGEAIPVVVEVAKMGRVDRIKLAKAEHASLRDWASKGKKGAPPATPVLDWLKDNPSGSVQRRSQIRKSKAANPRGARVACTVRYSIDGRELNEGSQSLSTITWHYSKGLDPSKVRLSTREFRAFLADNGVSEPETTEWEVELSGGRKLSAKLA